MEQLRICALSPQLLPSRRRIRSFEDLLVQNALSASQCALRSMPCAVPGLYILAKAGQWPPQTSPFHHCQYHSVRRPTAL
jgi:hypothetical protein